MDALIGKLPRSLSDSISYYAETFPHKLAIADSHNTISYAELDRNSAACAQAFISMGIMPGDAVVCYAKKEVSLVIAIIACLRMGVTYVPVDPKNPAVRMQYILEETKPRAILVPEKMVSEVSVQQEETLLITLESISPFAENSVLDESVPSMLWPEVDPHEVAYCMYTSGSTGQPKGVMIEHTSMISFFEAVNDLMLITRDSICMNTSPFYFDVSIVDTFLPLYCGASVYLYDGLMVPSLVLQYISKKKITHFAAVSPILSLLADDPALTQVDLSNLRTIMTGAEVLNVKMIQKWLHQLPGITIINGYGPTEATCVCVAYPITAADADNETLYPIGLPLSGIFAALLDEEEHLVTTPGVSGELLIAGSQLMRGYWGKPEETSARLLQIEGRAYYRTGDMCMVDEQGIYHYLARRDDEVKILGYRINLNEIRTAFHSIPAVKDLVISVIEEDGRGKVLAAGVILSDGSVDSSRLLEIRQLIKDKLLDYMVPRYLLLCRTFPKLPSGKTDVKRIKHELAEQMKRDKTGLYTQSNDW